MRFWGLVLRECSDLLFLLLLVVVWRKCVLMREIGTVLSW